MQTPDSVLVVDRFFLCLESLKAHGRIRGTATFCKLYGINRGNFIQLRSDHSRGIFQVGWLTFLVRDFGVSPSWLLTGEGSMLDPR